jgi:hypothetical protein
MQPRTKPIPSFSQGYAVREASKAPNLWKNVVGAYAPFLGNQGNTLYDWSGFNRHGAINGASWVPGLDGYALGFDGDNDYVNYGNVAAFNYVDGPFTISFDAKIDDNTRSAQIITKRLNGDVLTKGYFIGLSADTGIFLEISDGFNEDRIITTTLPENNVWYHYDFIRDGADSKIFVDGIQDDDETNLTTGSILNNTNFIIGNRGDLNVTLFFGGAINNITIQNIVKRNSDIKQLTDNPYIGYEPLIKPRAFFVPVLEELDLFNPQIENLKQSGEIKSLKNKGIIENLKEEGIIKWVQ